VNIQINPSIADSMSPPVMEARRWLDETPV